MASLLRRRPIATLCPIFCRQQLRRYGFRSGPPPPKMANVTFDAGGQTISIKTCKVPMGSEAVLTTGGTQVHAAVKCSWNDHPRDYLPLRVEYEEPRWSMWLDGGQEIRQYYCAHLINRLIKPLFPAGFYKDIEVTASSHYSDGMDPVVMAANATSAALMLSDIPWNGPIGVIRVGRINGKFIFNPRMDVVRYNDFNLVYACTMDKTLMIDGHGWEISEKDLQTGLELAHSEAFKYIDPQIRLAEEAGKKKGLYNLSMVSDRTLQKIKGIAEGPSAAVLNNSTYGKFQNEVLGTVKAEPVEECDEESLKVLPKVVDMVRNEIIRQRIIDQRLRVDGRQLDEVRPLFCDYGVCGILPGSYREIAQALWTVALVTPRYAERLDRHEAVYGTLVEKALLAALPPEDDFPYDVFIGRKVFGSDGSKSMATVCGVSIAMMFAGCPLREHVAGVSVGLISDVDPSGRITRYHILTDLSGFEEHLVDMDFKIAGTRKGITAIHLDTIHARIPLDIICECLEPARRGRNQILDNMEEEMDARRTILGLCDTMALKTWPMIGRDQIKR